jgi:hypothetical protein
MKRCKVCRTDFQPSKPLQKVCGYGCALSLATSTRARKEKRDAVKAHRLAKERLKTRAGWMKEAQHAFNAYIRLRDAALPCVSCGRHHDGQYHAGHYLSTGARPELRFDEMNVHKQCQPCNTHLHGNLVLYRAELIKRVGIQQVLRLEGPHEPMKPTIADLQALKAAYTAKARELRKATQ